jgi:hypothetical protein
LTQLQINFLISPMYYNNYICLKKIIQILGLTNPTPLNRNLVLEICKERDTIGLV